MSEAIQLEAFVRIDNPTEDDILDPRRLAILADQQQKAWNEDAMPQVRALLAAGWLPELSDRDLDTWQWAWRAPAKRAGKQGRRYASTSQAFNAMQRGKP